MRRIERELLGDFDEALELAFEDRHVDQMAGTSEAQFKAERKQCFRELVRPQGELVKRQDWVAAPRHKVVIQFEGRDAAGEGGVIKRITQRLSPRVVRVMALPAPSGREHTRWDFQRYVPRQPLPKEMVVPEVYETPQALRPSPDNATPGTPSSATSNSLMRAA